MKWTKSSIVLGCLMLPAISVLFFQMWRMEYSKVQRWQCRSEPKSVQILGYPSLQWTRQNDCLDHRIRGLSVRLFPSIPYISRIKPHETPRQNKSESLMSVSPKNSQSTGDLNQRDLNPGSPGSRSILRHSLQGFLGAFAKPSHLRTWSSQVQTLIHRT